MTELKPQATTGKHPETIAHDLVGTEGPVLLLLHEIPLDGRMWSQAAETLSPEGATALLPDLRGFGRSAGLPLRGSLDTHVGDLLALLALHGLDSVCVVGCGFGASVALALAQKAPTRVASLVLINTPARETQSPRARDDAQPTPTNGSVASTIEQALPQLLVASRTEANLELVRAIAKDQPAASIGWALEGERHAQRDENDRRSIQVPTWIVCGTADPSSTAEDARALAKVIPKAHLVMVEGSGRLVNLDNPARLHEVLLEVVKDAKARRVTALPTDTL